MYAFRVAAGIVAVPVYPIYSHMGVENNSVGVKYDKNGIHYIRLANECLRQLGLK